MGVTNKQALILILLMTFIHLSSLISLYLINNSIKIIGIMVMFACMIIGLSTILITQNIFISKKKVNISE